MKTSGRSIYFCDSRGPSTRHADPVASCWIECHARAVCQPGGPGGNRCRCIERSVGFARCVDAAVLLPAVNQDLLLYLVILGASRTPYSSYCDITSTLAPCERGLSFLFDPLRHQCNRFDRKKQGSRRSLQLPRVDPTRCVRVILKEWSRGHPFGDFMACFYAEFRNTLWNKAKLS